MELDQYQTNHDLQLSVNKADRRAKDLELRCDQLEEQLGSLRIFVQALVDLTWDKLDVAEEQLQARIQELKDEKKREEAEEEARKMKANNKAFACPNCGQPVATTSKVCFYCGKPASPPEDSKEPK